MTAIFAGAPLIVVPEIEHGLAEMLHDVAAVEIDVFDERTAVIAEKDDVFVFAGRPATFDHDADGIGWTHRCVDDVGRDKEGFALADEMIDDLVTFADADFDVALELVKIFLRIDLVKIIPRVRTFDHHDEKVAAIVEVKVADGRLEELAVGFNPVVNVNRRQDFSGCARADLFR